MISKLKLNPFLLFLSLVIFLGCSKINESIKTDPTAEITSKDSSKPLEVLKIIQCEAIPETTSCTLSSQPKQGQSLWLYGDLLVGDDVYKNGGLEIDHTGKIVELGCISTTPDAAVLSCPNQIISPGLINPHDHLGYNHNLPGGQNNDGGSSNPHYSICNDPNQAYKNSKCETYRYDFRHEWRKGLNGKPKIVAPWGGTYKSLIWNELRHVMAGTTTVIGAEGAAGLVRNPDVLSLIEGLSTTGSEHVNYNIFPLGDSSNVKGRSYGDCTYPKVVNTDVLDHLMFLPHVSEGINESANNEFYCLTGSGLQSIDLRNRRSTFIHSVAADPTNAKSLADHDMSIVWSPRSNISLYGNTAPITLYDNLGISIALSTDWTPSGSINMQRELVCAADFNKTFLNNHFSKQEIWKMATINAARAIGIDDQVGVLSKGYLADIAIYDTSGSVFTSYYDAVILGNVQNVSLVLRGGKPLYGDLELVQALNNSCETFPSDICGKDKAVCLSETGHSIDDFFSENANSYALYFCSKPEDEPSCVPARYQEYSGNISESDWDGDLIENEEDNCPHIFNPIRPMDNGHQADYNDNSIGDVCDPSPL